MPVWHFYLFPFLPSHKPQKHSHFFRLFCRWLTRLIFCHIIRKILPHFSPFLPFSLYSYLFRQKMTPLSPPFCPLHTVFTYCHFKTALHSCQLLLQVPKMKPYSSPFFAFSLIFTESADNLQKWNHFSRLFYVFIFTPTLLNSFLGLWTCQFTFFETIFFAFFAIMRFYGEKFQIMKPYPSPFFAVIPF